MQAEMAATVIFHCKIFVQLLINLTVLPAVTEIFDSKCLSKADLNE